MPRVLARYLGVALDSGRVIALAMDAEEFAIDYKVVVDIQRLDVVSGRQVELDAVWRVEPRNGHAFFDRATVWERLEEKALPDEHAAALDAERRAIRALAHEIAAGITHHFAAGNSNLSADLFWQGNRESRKGSVR